MKEIEVKAQLNNKETVLQELEKLGCVLSEPITQIDTVYAKIVGSVSEYAKNDHFLRIREKSDGRYIFTVKADPTKHALVKTEHETEILNPVEMRKAIFLMGYHIANKLTKIRQIGHYKDYEICVDEVEGLGSFIEVEKISDEDPEIVLTELKKLLFTLGILPEDETKKGYDIMVIEKEMVG